MALLSGNCEHGDSHQDESVSYYPQLLPSEARKQRVVRERHKASFIKSWLPELRAKSSQRLCLALLLFVLDPRPSMAAPVRSYSSKPPRWTNPCGIPSDPSLIHDMREEHDIDPSTDAEILTKILQQAKRVRLYMEEVRERYVFETFNLDFDTHHQLWKDSRTDWLPSHSKIPKELGEVTPQEHLRGLQMQGFMKAVYEYFQQYSVGLEQFILDQAMYGGPHQESIQTLETQVMQLLCELQVGMMEKGIRPNPDVPRDVMSEEFRDIEDESQRNLRDWIIFRDLNNAVEYSIDGLNHLLHGGP
ncbi:unnamed protein product [Darwinula stevensoni]|uniref:Uncharacterized protein n=1 Tax=Darwinula stevensoni TaxID=69355 RepID=A0A7R8XFU2_9CRUS|nr:unnamed protein product [Darwinula stevensoni]CAG0891897.1 unnamed protein product [Darwinula stevensoni]